MRPKPIPVEFDPDGFARFWAAYPRREAKKDAYKAWRQLQPSTATQDAILAALGWQVHANEWDARPQYCPLPASYLRAERWTDERRSGLERRQSLSAKTQRLIESSKGFLESA